MEKSKRLVNAIEARELNQQYAKNPLAFCGPKTTEFVENLCNKVFLAAAKGENRFSADLVGQHPEIKKIAYDYFKANGFKTKLGFWGVLTVEW